MNLLIVNLKHRCINFILHSLFFLRYSIKNFSASNRNYSFILSVTNHWVRLSWTRLTISKQTAMVPLPCIIQNIFSYSFLDILLITIFWILIRSEVSFLICCEAIEWPKREIECKFPLILAFEWFQYSSRIYHINYKLWF